MTQNDEHVNDTTEPTGDASPVGFCPYCDYQLVAIGTCPECGNDVTSERVRTKPRRLRRRRWIVRVTAVIAIIGAVVGGRWLVASPYFYRAWPNAMLIDAYPANAKAAGEVGRRLQAGRFWDDEVIRLVEKSLAQSIEIRSPRPAGIPLVGNVTIKTQPNALFSVIPNKMGSYLKPGDCMLGDTPLQYESLSSKTTDSMTAVGGVTATSQAIEIKYQMADTAHLGNHQLQQELVMQVEPADPLISKAYPALRDLEIALTTTATVEARDEPLSAFITEEYSPEVEALWRADVKFLAYLTGPQSADFQICLSERDRPYYIRYEFERRRPNGETYITTRGQTKTDTSNGPALLSAHLLTSWNQAPIMNVRLMTDVIAAWNDGRDVVNPVMMEWHQIDERTLSKYGAKSKPWEPVESCDRDYSISADVVRRLRPEEY